MDNPYTEKKIKQRISRYKSTMKKEKAQYQCIDDGAGKRYDLFFLYYLLGDNLKSKEYFSWYEKEFTDDVGEPIMLLCWSLMLHNMGENKEAKYILGKLMLSNLYFVPRLLGQKVEKHDMWQSSSDGDIEYFDYLPPEVDKKITIAEKKWISSCYESVEFRRIRKRYIEIFHSLQHTQNQDERKSLLNESYELLVPLK